MAVEKLFSVGVDKVILGTAALYDKTFLEEAVLLYKEKSSLELMRKMVS